MLGIQILLGVKDGYNIFGDTATIPLILFLAVICIGTHRACIALGRFFKIWHVQLPLEKSEIKKDTTNIAELFMKVLEPKAHMKSQG